MNLKPINNGLRRHFLISHSKKCEKGYPFLAPSNPDSALNILAGWKLHRLLFAESGKLFSVCPYSFFRSMYLRIFQNGSCLCDVDLPNKIQTRAHGKEYPTSCSLKPEQE